MTTFQYPILATGAALPGVRLTNADLVARGVQTTDEWVKTRTGIAQRYICGPSESTFTLALAAGRQALERAGMGAEKVGVILVATCTPDLTFPSVAAMAHGALGLPKDCIAMDINAACSGFVHALATARALLADGQGRGALVIGADAFSKIVDWNDRGTCVLFGDGAGAVVMGKEPAAGTPRGLLGSELGTDGTQVDPLKASGGVATTQTAGVVLMKGGEVFKLAVRQMGSVPPILGKLGLALKDIDWLVPHQANLRILEAAREALQLPPEKVVITVDAHANTSAASIPLALDTAARDGRLKTGDVVLLEAFGAGMAWSSAVLRW
jgi:3-oxoacyl-[acyl-carrier-protein] synthase-3